MLSSVVVLVLVQAAAARPVQPAPTGQCGAVVVSSAQAPRARGKFSASKILDVEFVGALRRRLTGRHVLNLKVYTPKGHLYQELSVPFDSGNRVGTTSTRATGRPPKLAARLPVGGTSITNASLYGKWRVVPYLDGSLRACGVATSFSINP